MHFGLILLLAGVVFVVGRRGLSRYLINENRRIGFPYGERDTGGAEFMFVVLGLVVGGLGAALLLGLVG